MAKILVVDDDVELSEALADHLGVQGFAVEVCHTGEDALQLLGGFHYELIVLDWSMPGISGEEVCRKYRAGGGQTPIIFLTGRGDIHHLETGLGAGADDYVVKPFDIRELTARVKTLLKRRTGAYSEGLQVDGLKLDIESRSIRVGDKVIELRAKEISLLEFLMRNTNRVYSAQQLLEAVWPSDAEVTTGSVRTWMNLLRQKLADAGKPDLIETVPRSGYTIRV
jgi:OmpR-family two-component system manganese-sensing response regulator